MRIKQRAFPHPVVGNGNDVDAAFQAPVQVFRRDDVFEIQITCQMSSDSLQKRIGNREAAYGLHIECTKTFFRELKRFTPRNGNATVCVPVANLSGTVELNVVMFALKDIKNYRINGAHSDYGRKTFFISQGDFLAVAEGHLFNADIHQDMLESVASIMEIKRRDDDGTDMTVDFGGQKIRVLLPNEDYGIYKAIQADPTFANIAVASIVLPVLMDALKMVRQGSEEYESCRWYDNLVLRLSKKGLDRNAPVLENSQQLLEMPIGRLLRSYRDLLLSDDGDEA